MKKVAIVYSGDYFDNIMSIDTVLKELRDRIEKVSGKTYLITIEEVEEFGS